MRYLSVCSGIEAATVAWHNLGWTPVGFSEIEPFPSAVLAHHYPNVPNFGDMTQHDQWPLQPGSIDLLVGGTPCQSFSVAGLRKGLHDPRGGLMLTYLEIARRLRPRWVVWENVPGVLSSNGGRDFGSFLGAMGLLGYGWAYRVLDAQWVRTQRHPRAVSQRRRRVFVVGCLGDGERAAKVLFECESVCRDSAPRRAPREGATADVEAGVGAGRVTSHDVAPCLETTSNDYSRADGFTMIGQVSATIAARFGNSRNNHKKCLTQPIVVRSGSIGGFVQDDVGGTMRAKDGDYHGGSESLVMWPADVAATLDRSSKNSGPPGGSNQEIFSQHGANLIPQPVPYDLFQITAPVNRQNRKPGDPCHTLARDNAAHAAVAHAIPLDLRNSQRNPEKHDAQNRQGVGVGSVEDPAPTVDASFVHGVAQAMTVRRLTPRECERLQGFPDDYTLIPWRKKAAADCPDGPRYKALGNSMAVNCMAWIGERIAAVENHNAS